MDNVSFVRFLIVSAVSSYYLSKFAVRSDELGSEARLNNSRK